MLLAESTGLKSARPVELMITLGVLGGAEAQCVAGATLPQPQQHRATSPRHPVAGGHHRSAEVAQGVRKAVRGVARCAPTWRRSDSFGPAYRSTSAVAGAAWGGGAMPRTAGRDERSMSVFPAARLFFRWNRLGLLLRHSPPSVVFCKVCVACHPSLRPTGVWCLLTGASSWRDRCAQSFRADAPMTPPRGSPCVLLGVALTPRADAGAGRPVLMRLTEPLEALPRVKLADAGRAGVAALGGIQGWAMID